MKEITTTKGTFIFIEVEKDARNFQYDSWFTRYINYSKGSIKLDVNTKIISTTKDITEEKAKSIVENKSHRHSDYGDFKNYIDNGWTINTAKESLQSLMEANELNLENNYLILQKL
jgi:hypothetical protein